MDSKSLLNMMGVLTIQHRTVRLNHKKESLERIKKLYIIFKKLQMLEREETRRQYWVRDIFTREQRFLQGASKNLVDEMRSVDREKYFNFLQMYPEMFDELLVIVKPHIEKQNWVREPICAKTRLELTLRYLASGDSMISLSYFFRVGQSTASEIIATTCQAIWNTLRDKVFMKPTKENWKRIAQEFHSLWNFKNCIGAIDGKHVVTQAFPKCGSKNYNYKGAHSINLLAVADAKYQFIMVDIGAEGRRSDSGVLKESAIGQGFQSNMFNLPSSSDLPYDMVADEAFPLTDYMMWPYSRRGNLDVRKKVFIYRLSRARRIIESSFGILASVWRIFREPIIASESTTRKIVQACVCLHNYLLEKKGMGGCREKLIALSETSTEPSKSLNGFNSCSSNMYSRNAADIREKFTEYFCGPGALDWQLERAINNDF